MPKIRRRAKKKKKKRSSLRKGTSENLRRTKIRIRNCSTQIQSDFLPKIRERAKKKRKKRSSLRKGTSENLRRTKIRIRNCSTQIPSDFLPKIKGRAKKIRKKRFSLKLSTIFGQSWVRANNKRIKHTLCAIQARSQKFAMGELFWGFGGKAPSRRRRGGLEALPPALENFAFFLQKQLYFRDILIKNNVFETWLRNWQCKHN